MISAGRAAEMLDVSRYEIDGTLKRAGVYLGYTVEDLKRNRETHRLMGLSCPLRELEAGRA